MMMTSAPNGLKPPRVSPDPAEPAFVSQKRWSVTRPTVLVVACSDGRLQESIDEFLVGHLGISHYDSLYAPGGPGALASSGYEFSRSEQFRHDFGFLLEAHGTEEVLLILHGAAAGGPEDATCADYRRKLPRRSPVDLRRQQIADAEEILRVYRDKSIHVRMRVYLAEVTGDKRVHFLLLADSAL